ncbi:PHP domain-containing protein [Thermanaerosceptrum fracticalcis]|uniref:PHP domain-containing protein n=1 Tax=Thermanaerosceptrum fracticalcis TaxID=1712410 RepID=A0A7G6E467_THEFR|nr:phosphatase [Thermanaerosceptrum fracticalcis]QNB46871.1 PHP domain-containing protein [Thermanaerosceptrum fracticalcis]
MEIVADLHTHSVASGHAYSTIQEIITAARENGLKLVAITDHGPAMPGAPHSYHFSNLRIIPTSYNGVEVLRGVEANIMDYEGNLDLAAKYLRKLDIVLAGFHQDCLEPGSVEDNTRTMIKAMQNPLVDIIVHPGNPSFAIDAEKVVQASLELGIPLEINNSSLAPTASRQGSLHNCKEIARLAARYGSFISLGSDAHWAPLVGKFPEAYNLIREAGIREEKVLNTSLDLIKKFLGDRKQAKANIR